MAELEAGHVWDSEMIVKVVGRVVGSKMTRKVLVVRNMDLHIQDHYLPMAET